MKMKFLHVTEVEHLGDFRLSLVFNDGSKGEIDLKDDLDGEIFRPLKADSEFRKARIEGGTVSWPNGADMAPEYLRSKIAEPIDARNR